MGTVERMHAEPEVAPAEVRLAAPAAGRVVGGNQMTGRLLAGTRPAGRLASGREPSPAASIGIGLLGGGNGAFTRFVRRCGPVPCNCDEEERAKYDALHRSAEDAGEMSRPPSAFLDALGHTGSGHALASDFRAEAEQKFGTSFTGVRVHTGDAAARAAEAVSAKAFTIGHDVYFGADQYRPRTDAGRRLLAHELTHVTQDVAAPAGSRLVSHPSDPAELAAEATADRFMAAEPSTIEIAAGGQAAIHRVPAECDPVEQRNLIEEAIRDKDIGKVKDIEDSAFGLASDGQAIDMILILLNQGWVGPRDEYAIYQIWRSRGSGVLDLASKYAFVWNMCLQRGVTTLWSIPDLNPVRADFTQAVAAKARSYLDLNKKTVADELQRYGLDQMNAPPTPDKAREREDLMVAANAVRKANDALKQMASMLVGYDYVGGTPDNPTIQRCVAMLNVAVPPPYPGMPPVPAEEGAVLPSWGEAVKNYERAHALIDHYTRRYPALVALREDSDLNEVARTSVSSDEAGGELAAMQIVRTALDDTAANIDKTYGLLGDPKGGFALELQPIHEQLLLFDPGWRDPFRQMVARNAVQEHGDVEFWKTIGVSAMGLALFVVAEMASGGLATFFFAAAAGTSIAQAAASWDKYFSLKAAASTHLSPETALVTRDQASEQLLTATLDTLMAFMDAYGAAKGGAEALAKAGEAETKLGTLVAKEGAAVAAEHAAARVEVAAGHEVRATEAGILRCSPECPLIGEFWHNSLERHPDIKNRLELDAQRARTDPVWAAQDAAGADRALQDITELEIEQWAASIPETGVAGQPGFSSIKRLPELRADIAPKVLTEEERQFVEANVAQMKAEGRLPADYVYAYKSAPGAVIPLDVARSAMEVVGVRISDNAAVAECWADAARSALGNQVLTPENYADIYKSAAGRFWNRVAGNPAAKAFFEAHGFTVNGKRAAFLDVTGVAGQELSLGLDHTFPKATGENYRFALDGDKLQFLMQADNTKLSHLEKKDPSLRR